MQERIQVKEEARKLAEGLPEDVSWSDFARLVLDRQRIEDGIADLDAGIIWTSDETRKKLGKAGKQADNLLALALLEYSVV